MLVLSQVKGGRAGALRSGYPPFPHPLAVAASRRKEKCACARSCSIVWQLPPMPLPSLNKMMLSGGALSLNTPRVCESLRALTGSL